MGGSAITSYHLQWDYGTNEGDWQDLVGFNSNYLSTSYILTSGVLPNKKYNFKVRGKNIYGFGDYTDPFPIYTRQEPAQVTNVATENDGLDVLISWDEPFDNYEIITDYYILFRDVNGVYHDYNTTCDGMND